MKASRTNVRKSPKIQSKTKKKIERFSIHIYCQNWIFSVHSPSPVTVGAQNLTPQPPPPPRAEANPSLIG